MLFNLPEKCMQSPPSRVKIAATRNWTLVFDILVGAISDGVFWTNDNNNFFIFYTYNYGTWELKICT